MTDSYLADAADMMPLKDIGARWVSSSTQGDRGDGSSTTAVNEGNRSYGDDTDEDKVSTLEYARLCGFCRNFLSDDPLMICASNPLPFDRLSDIEDPKGFISAIDISLDSLICERMEVSIEVGFMLQKIVMPNDGYLPLDDLHEEPRNYGLRMELPLLSTDHEMDIRSFGKTQEHGYRQLKLPMEYVNIENDEGLEWPIWSRRLPEDVTNIIDVEKLECPRAAVKYLQDLLVDTVNEEELDAFYSQVEEFTMVRIVPQFIKQPTKLLYSQRNLSQSRRLCYQF
jgi:hypothetical protein